jgi:hypothetical protein
LDGQSALVTDSAGLTPAEEFVLFESDGHAQLWELAAGWTDNGEKAQRVAAVPLLAAALVSLVQRGLVEVYDYSTWPSQPGDASRIAVERVPEIAGDAANWLWREESCTVPKLDAGL